MADVVLPERPALAVIPNVTILEVGEQWPASTGPWTVTPDHIASAVEAINDPGVHAGRIKLGHTAKWGDAEPTLGTLQNLRAANNGMTLVADLVGVPRWMAEALPHTWPNRSIEADLNVHSAQTTRTHPCVITALALLGVKLPAIDTLEDFRSLLAAQTMAEAHVTLTTAASQGAPMPADRSVSVAASVTTEDIRQAYYGVLGPGQDWWWIREIELDPLTLIVDDDEGGLWRVPVTISGTDITFGTPEAVRVEYVAAASTSASRSEPAAIVWASRAESREGVATMDPAALRTSLGLAETATDEEVLARAAELAARPEPTPAEDTPSPDPSAEVDPPANATAVPAGSVVVDAVQWGEVQRQAAEGALAASRMRTQERDRFIGDVVKAGRLTRANAELRASLEREWDRDPENARKIAASLAVVIPTTERGHGEGSDDIGDSGGWTESELRAFPELRQQGGR